MMNLLLAQDDPTKFVPARERPGDLWMPEQASSYAAEVDTIFYFIYGVSAFFTILIVALLVIFILRFRQRDKRELGKGATHSNLIEVGWALPPTVLVLAFFAFGFKGYLDINDPPPDAEEILVVAKQWGWYFQHDNGKDDSKHLVIPVGRPVVLKLTSQDVIHSLFVPAFRAKKDCVPGRVNTMWFTAEKPGEYNLFCTEYCGQGHSQMNVVVRALPEKEYQDWKKDFSPPDDMTPAAFGKRLYVDRGCATCHSVDGSANTGPTWKDLYGRPNHRMADGSVVEVDENYIREAILYPGQQIVAGYPNQMPVYEGQLRDFHILALTQYMKQLSQYHKGPLLETFDEKQEAGDEAEAGAEGAEGAATQPGG